MRSLQGQEGSCASERRPPGGNQARKSPPQKKMMIRVPIQKVGSE